MIQHEHYIIQAQGNDKVNYIINLKKPPFITAMVYKWRNGEEVAAYMAKFPNSVQVDGFNIVVAYSCNLFSENLYREYIDIELHRMAEYYLREKVDRSLRYYKHYKV